MSLLDDIPPKRYSRKTRNEAIRLAACCASLHPLDRGVVWGSADAFELFRCARSAAAAVLRMNIVPESEFIDPANSPATIYQVCYAGRILDAEAEALLRDGWSPEDGAYRLLFTP